MTSNQSDQVPTDIIQQKRSLQTTQTKTYTQTFKERDVIHIKPDTPFAEDSRKLVFHVKPQVDRAFNPSDMYLRIPIKLEVVNASDTQLAPMPELVGFKLNFAGSAKVELTSGYTTHARFRNPAHVHLIKKVQILPNRQNDIEIQDEEKTQLCEWMRYALQNTRVEKDHVENELDNGAYRGLFECETPYVVALKEYNRMWKQEERDMQEAQLLFKGGIYHEFKIKIPGVWNETDVFIPSMYEFLVKIHLASDAECLLSDAYKQESSSRHTIVSPHDSKYDVVYRLDVANTELIVEYVELEDGDKENFKGTFFGMTDVQMEAYHGINFVSSLPFKKNNGEKLVLKQDFDEIQGAVPSKFFLGLLTDKAITGEGLTQGEPRFAFQPFNVSKIDVKLGGKSIFNEQPLDWRISTSNKIKMFRYLSDCTRREFEYNERTNPFCKDPYSMNEKWFTYIDLHKEAGTSFSDVTPRLNTDISFELTFAGNAPTDKIRLVLIYTNMPFSTLKDGVANRWEPIQTFAPPIIKRERNTLAIRDGLR